MAAEQRGRAELLTFIGTVVGHGAAPHPSVEGGFVSAFVVRIPGRWVVCMAEGDVPYDWTEARKGLGRKIPGDQFAPRARRGIPDSVPFDEVRKIVGDSFEHMGFRFEWWEGAQADEAPPPAPREGE